jgi:hypothetical protein
MILKNMKRSIPKPDYEAISIKKYKELKMYHILYQGLTGL